MTGDYFNTNKSGTSSSYFQTGKPAILRGRWIWKRCMIYQELISVLITGMDQEAYHQYHIYGSVDGKQMETAGR